jgi:hypothetical protein
MDLKRHVRSIDDGEALEAEAQLRLHMGIERVEEQEDSSLMPRPACMEEEDSAVDLLVDSSQDMPPQSLEGLGMVVVGDSMVECHGSWADTSEREDIADVLKVYEHALLALHTLHLCLLVHRDGRVRLFELGREEVLLRQVVAAAEEEDNMT